MYIWVSLQLCPAEAPRIEMRRPRICFPMVLVLAIVMLAQVQSKPTDSEQRACEELDQGQFRCVSRKMCVVPEERCSDEQRMAAQALAEQAIVQEDAVLNLRSSEPCSDPGKVALMEEAICLDERQASFDSLEEPVCCFSAYIHDDAAPQMSHESPVAANLTEQNRPKAKSCGVVSSTINERVLGDQVAQFGEWPFMCIVFRLHKTATANETSSSQSFLAGASLITPGIVLTAAHWIFDLTPDEVSVRCGDYDLRLDNESLPHQERLAHRISIHPEFGGVTTLVHDIALIHLQSEFLLAPHISPVCLPDVDDVLFGDKLDLDQCMATGWGKKSSVDTVKSNVLQEVNLPLMDNIQCQQELQRTRLGPSFILHPSFVCAGGFHGEDTCKGDGGGPLVCPVFSDPDSVVQVGIVSWGVGCGLSQVPGVYSSVLKDLCFIDWTTKCLHQHQYAEYYSHPKCNSWLQNSVDTLTDTIALYKAESAKSSDTNTSSLLARRIAKLQDHLENYDTLKGQCSEPIEAEPSPDDDEEIHERHE